MTAQNNIESRQTSLSEELAKQKKELTDSIRYASYIQKAMLPPLELFTRFIPSGFLYFRPRDLVSGDFYWIGKVKDSIVVAAADCTGHGVPGGLMSMMGISFMNEIIGKGQFNTASSILNQLRERVMKALHQTGKWDEQKDGMDIALCLIDTKKKLLHFSGANNPMYLVHSGELTVFPGDKMPIGIHMATERSFTDWPVDINETDMVYLFTDGFIDQFGGEKGKKFKNSRFRELIISLYGLPPLEQKAKLNGALNTWMHDQYQIDDILVIGFEPFHTGLNPVSK